MERGAWSGERGAWSGERGAGSQSTEVRDQKSEGRQRGSLPYNSKAETLNGASGMSDMSGKASRAEVEHCGRQLRYNGANGMSDPPTQTLRRGKA